MARALHHAPVRIGPLIRSFELAKLLKSDVSKVTSACVAANHEVVHVDDQGVTRVYTRRQDVIYTFQEAKHIADTLGKNAELEDNEPPPLLSPKEAEVIPGKEKVPVVAILGHVDHGKTTLLDAIAKMNVAKSEAGNITQKVSAYTISTPQGPFTFLDTPGHAAFDFMRQTAALGADVACVVVSAVDGIESQTKEVLSLAKDMSMPVVTAINKCDLLPGGVLDEKGTETMRKKTQAENFVSISALHNKRIDGLLAALAVTAKKAGATDSPVGPPAARVIEVTRAGGSGITLKVIAARNSIKPKDTFVVHQFAGTVRAIDSTTEKKQLPSLEAGCAGALRISFFAENMDLKELGEAELLGEVLHVVPSRDAAVALLAARRLELDRSNAVVAEAAEEGEEHPGEEEDLTQGGEEGKSRQPVIKADLKDDTKEEAETRIPITIKADNAGSLETLLGEMQSRGLAQKVRVVHAALGSVNRFDLKRAAMARPPCSIYCFNVNPGLEQEQRKYQVEVHRHNVFLDMLTHIDRDATVKLKQAKLAAKAKEKKNRSKETTIVPLQPIR